MRKHASPCAVLVYCGLMFHFASDRAAAQYYIDTTQTINATAYLLSPPGQLIIGNNAVLNLLNGATGTGISTFVIGDAANYSGGLYLDGGSQLFSGATVLAFSVGSVGTATVAGDSTWTADILGIGYYGQGYLNIEDGGTVNSLGVHIAAHDFAYGEATIRDAGTTWNISDILLGSGFSSTANLNLLSGGIVNSSSAVVANDNSSIAAVTISGNLSRWNVTGDLWIGNRGTGSIFVQNGGTLYSTGTSKLGEKSDGTGSVTVNGVGSAWYYRTLSIGSSGTGGVIVQNGGAAIINGTGGGDLFVGDGGVGTLQVLNGGAFASGNSILGNSSTTGSYGSVTVSGTGSTWNNYGQLKVGKAGDGYVVIEQGASAVIAAFLQMGSGGNGSFSVLSGGVVSSSSAAIGTDTAATGAITVSGPGSTWNNSGDFYVGGSGSGSIQLRDQGAITSSNVYLGGNTGSSGTFSISDAGTTLTNGGGIYVGGWGNGTMTLQGGGLVRNQNTYIGGYTGATGVVTIAGSGSTWFNAGDLAIGGLGGSAKLTVTGGGKMIVGGLTAIGHHGELRIGNGGTLQTGSLSIFSDGRLTIDSGGTYLGNTGLTVSGTFFANGSVPGQVIVSSGGTLKGGSVGNPGSAAAVGAIVVNSGGTLSPGNSVGQLNISGTDVVGGASITLNAGANVVFEFKNAAGSTPGTDWDLLDLGVGILDLGTAGTASGLNRINLYIDPWVIGNTGHGANDFNPANSYEWLFIKTSDLINLTGGLGGSATAGNIANYFDVIDNDPGRGIFGVGNPLTEGQRMLDHQFNVQWKTTSQGSGLYVTYSAVPEPASGLLAGLASLGLGWYRCRSRRVSMQQ